MKKIILLVFSLSSFYNFYGQCDSTLPVAEDFSSSSFNTCWNIIDNDNDGLNWHIEDNMLVSSSWTAETGPLSPDNWAISNAIDLRNYSSSSNIKLTWKVRTPDWSFDKERYAVYAASGNQLSNFTSSSVSFYEDLDDSDGSGLVFVSRNLDLSALAGQMVYIAFRHYNSTDQNEINIDDIIISTCTSSDSDNDGVCDDLDQCPGFNDSIDLNGNGIPDGCEPDSCEGKITSFSGNSLSHTGSGSKSATLNLPSNSQNVLFNITSINEKLKGKASSKYAESVVISYVNGSGSTQTYGTFSGSSVSSVSVDIQGIVKSVKVTLSNSLGGSTSSNMNINFSQVSYCVETTPCILDSDGDGVCDSDDICPGFDDNLDANGNGTPDGCESSGGCVENSTNFTNNNLTHSGPNSSQKTITLPANSQNVLFTISGIGQKLKGKSSSKYIDHVIVSYRDANGNLQTYDSYSGSPSNITVDISSVVQSVMVSLSDDFDGDASSLSINFSAVSYCIESSAQSKIGTSGKIYASPSLNSQIDNLAELIKIYPNPVSQDLYIKFITVYNSSLEASLFNVSGQMVRKAILNVNNGNTHHINLDGVSNGLYLLRITNTKGSVLSTQRLVVN